MLDVADLDVYYGDLQALWSVSLTVEEREIVALIGSNGAGKST
ncbi:MAG: ATP-binding cassette domain-containing protein, partial [Deltaproteobacteria bacterium]